MPLPRHYVTGLDAQKLDNDIGFLNYLGGEYRQGGWWYYYFYALGIRIPLGTMAIFLLSIMLALTRKRYCLSYLDELCLALPPLAVFILISSQTGLQDSRYLLPCLPFVCILCGRAAPWCKGPRPGRAVFVLALLGWSIVGGLRYHPYELAYFNETVGGPAHGARYLSETLHWGQDLLTLKEWLDEHPEASPLGLAYVGPTDPLSLEIAYTVPPYWSKDTVSPPAANDSCGSQDPEQDRPRFYAVSVYLIQGRDWDGLGDGTGGSTSVPWNAYRYFSSLQPVARAGYTINIYKASPCDLERICRDWVPPSE